MSKLILLVLVEEKMALTDTSINLQSLKTQATFISAGNKLKHIPSCPKIYLNKKGKWKYFQQYYITFSGKETESC